MHDQILWLENINKNDIHRVGGKNASLGEMISNLSKLRINVPGGFATTTDAFRDFIDANDLSDWINSQLDDLDTDDVKQLALTGKAIRQKIITSTLPADLIMAVNNAYEAMQKDNTPLCTVAVRSSATAEDLPNASFAGQQETYLNIKGSDNVIDAIKRVYASLYNDRAISYRIHNDITHEHVAISVTVQKMVNSADGASGVMFSIDTESGFEDAVCITGSYGLGETIVQGEVNPDEFAVYKPSILQQRPAIVSRKLGNKDCKMIFTQQSTFADSVQTVGVSTQDQTRFCITDTQVEELARIAISIEDHYGFPMDIEWALDGDNNKIYIVQARPETVVSQNKHNNIEHYQLKHSAKVLIQGSAIGQRIGSGTVRVLSSADEMDQIKPGDVLVTRMTDPDWEPIMKRASAIITDQGGRTCHAAIIARELGVPAIVGCGNATDVLHNDMQVTASCAEGETGNVYEGLLEYEINHTNVGELANLPVNIMMNLADPGRAFSMSRLPNAGVGLARLEFIINNQIGIHPRALLEYDDQSEDIKACIDERMCGYATPVSFYVEKLTEGIATIAAAYAPEKVIVRMSDFKSNEYANLIGGKRYEPEEENPMIGFRGASRYLSDDFGACFELECQAIKQVRDNMGLNNVEIMIPFCRTVKEAREVIHLLEKNGLKRGNNGLRIIMMCEIPANALLADDFLQYFDGFSIGSNDMTQLTLGLDRDAAQLANMFDERNDAVKHLLLMAITACQRQGKYIGICGQAPSDYPEFAEWLMQQGITSLSLSPDTVVSTWKHLSENDNMNSDTLGYFKNIQSDITNSRHAGILSSNIEMNTQATSLYNRKDKRAMTGG